MKKVLAVLFSLFSPCYISARRKACPVLSGSVINSIVEQDRSVDSFQQLHGNQYRTIGKSSDLERRRSFACSPGADSISSRIGVDSIAPCGISVNLLNDLPSLLARRGAALILAMARHHLVLGVSAALTVAILVIFGHMPNGLSGLGAPVPIATTPVHEATDIDGLKVVSERQVSDTHDPYHTLPVWSADGSKIVFVKRPEWVTQAGMGGWSPWGEVWIADGDGSNARLIVANGLGPTFSAATQWLYYSSTEPQEPATDLIETSIYRSRLDGTNAELLYRGSPNRSIYVAPCIQPDGRLAFLTDGKIGRIEPNTPRFEGFMSGLTGVSGFWCSPDGSQLAFTKDYNLWMGSYDGREFRQLGSVSVDERLPISWSANSQSLVYTTVRELWVAKGDGSNPRRISKVSDFPDVRHAANAGFSRPFISPDGSIVFVSFFEGATDERIATYAVEVASGHAKIIAEGKWLAAISPNASMGLLTYSRTTPGGSTLWPLTAVSITR